MLTSPSAANDDWMSQLQYIAALRSRRRSKKALQFDFRFMYMPSFLFVELSRHHLRNLHHNACQLILTPASDLPYPFQVGHNLTV